MNRSALGLIYVLVSNDLVHDQRVKKTCGTLSRLGWETHLLGRHLPQSEPLPQDLQGTRLNLFFHKGALFYAALQIRFFWFLLFRRMDGIWANDLDTLLPAFLISRIRGIPLVYDSHEFFTEAAGLTHRRFQRGVWLAVERSLHPRIRAVLTVNESIAAQLHQRYPNAKSGRPLVLRNMPMRAPRVQVAGREAFARVGIPTDRPIALLQGAFMDTDRGIREAVEAARGQDRFRLVLIGAGPEWEWANQEQSAVDLAQRLFCLPKQPYEELRKFTASADVGLSLDKGVHGNYLLSLPNKLFDYIHAGIPVVASPLPEVEKVVKGWDVGVTAVGHDAGSIQMAIEAVLQKPRSHWEHACAQAAEFLHWGADEPQIAVVLREAGFRDSGRRTRR